MLDSARLVTVAGTTMHHLTALKPHEREKHVEKDTGIIANLKKDVNITREGHVNFYILKTKQNV